MLGVDPDAGFDEIRARYRALARQRHPDRQAAGGSGADQRSTDAPLRGPEPTMAEINAAWTVLGDPERRAAYDERLGRGGALGGRSEPPRYAPASPPPAHEPVTPIGCAASLAGAAPWIAVLVVLGAIFVFTAYAGSGDDPVANGRDQDRVEVDDDPMVAVRDVRGRCIQVVRGAPNVVDCFTQPNEGRIVAQASIGASCPTGTTEWTVRHQGVLACTEGNGNAGGQ